MAVQSVTSGKATNEGVANLISTIADACDGPGGTPNVPGRELAGWLGMNVTNLGLHAQDTVVASSAGATDNIEVLLDFTPQVVVIVNETQDEAYVKFASMSSGGALVLVSGGIAYTADVVTMGNNDASSDTAFTVDASVLTASDALHYWAIG
jgi:hypothetical protein